MVPGCRSHTGQLGTQWGAHIELGHQELQHRTGSHNVLEWQNTLKGAEREVPHKEKVLTEKKPHLLPISDTEHLLLTGILLSPFPMYNSFMPEVAPEVSPAVISSFSAERRSFPFLAGVLLSFAFFPLSPYPACKAQNGWLNAVCSLAGNIPQIHLFWHGGSPIRSHCSMAPDCCGRSRQQHWPQGAGAVALLLMDDLLLTVVWQAKPAVFDYIPGSVASVTDMVNEPGWNKQVY